MINKKERPELLVLKVLSSSKKIEYAIKKTYVKNYQQVKRHPSIRMDQMPIFVAFLYDLIIEMKSLPSNEIFVERYMRKYFDDIPQDRMIYHAYVYRINKAYESLIRDLHFYFKLLESNLFDDVHLSYAYDIEGKQDVVVTKGSKKMGLQLFIGDDNTTLNKKKQTERRSVYLGYPDFFLPLYGSKANPIDVGSKGNPFYLHSNEDVKLIYNEITSNSNQSKEIIEESFVVPIPRKEISSNENKYSITDKKQYPSHSYVYVGEESIDNYQEFVKELTKRGVRIEWISPYLSENKSNIRVHNLRKTPIKSFSVIDGSLTDKQKEILRQIGKTTTFNYEQYITEHAIEDKHLIIEAGAGSGKTETIISRIMYLLHLGKVNDLEEIVMITFTNEASDNMKSKLFNKLFNLFQLTGELCYITWSEQVSSMRILTIPAFSKTLLQDFSAELGMSRNFNVRSLTIERKEIIYEIIDEFITKENLTYHDLGGLKEHELTELINKFWNQFEQKGIVYENYQDIDWGLTPRLKVGENLHKLFLYVFENCERRFSEQKLSQDIYTVNDLTQKISNIEPYVNKSQLSQPFNFLFVDEFQDTDDVQIELVKTLAQKTEAQLFVVGDIKQSIYRFRGANYTAFDLLESKLGTQSVDRGYKLLKNYRTVSSILVKLENLFNIWRENDQEILPKNESELISTINHSKYSSPVEINRKSKKLSKEIKRLYNSMILDEGDNKPVELAILVRTNFQANNIRNILDKMREDDSDIVYDIQTGGNLFSTEAAKDLLILINALCYDNDPESLYSLTQTPFSTESFNPGSLIEYQGKNEEILNSITLNNIVGFKEAKTELKEKPLLHVIYHFLTLNPYENVLKMLDKQSHEIEKYRLNLYRILELAYDAVNYSVLNINTLRDWLKIQIATNRDEDEMEVDVPQVNKIIRVITVHKAKGLEFDTVFIPFTDHKMVKKASSDMIVLRHNDEVKAGWKTKINRDSIESNNYQILKKIEDQESIREEARLLYVAMTRAENRLIVNVDDSSNEKSLNKWSDLIRLGKEGE